MFSPSMPPLSLNHLWKKIFGEKATATTNTIENGSLYNAYASKLWQAVPKKHINECEKFFQVWMINASDYLDT